MTQSRSDAERLMEQEHYPVDYEDSGFMKETAAIEDEDEDLEGWDCRICACGHYEEDHEEYQAECCICECTEFQPN
jgi:hypothetical protein